MCIAKRCMQKLLLDHKSIHPLAATVPPYHKFGRFECQWSANIRNYTSLKTKS